MEDLKILSEITTRYGTRNINSVGASEEEIEKIKEKENEVRNDIIKALSSKNENFDLKQLSKITTRYNK